MELTKILITTWGNPWKVYPNNYRWCEVKYFMNKNSRKSRTTLPLLYEVIKPNKVITIVQDTVVFNPQENYIKLINYVKNIYKEFLKEILKETHLENKIEVIVAPGIGSFKNKVRNYGKEITLQLRFKGLLQDFYSYVLAKISKSVINTLITNSNNCEKVELHLDLTHGINYMPTLTYRAVRRIAGIISWGIKNVKLKVYNSEPYVQGVEEYEIHEVEKSEVATVSDFKIVTNGFKLVKTLGENYGCKVKDLRNKVKNQINWRELNAFLGSIVNGLPLITYVTYPDTNKLSQVIDNVLKFYEETTTIDKYSNNLVIKHNVAFKEDFNTLIESWVLASVIKNFVKKESEISLKNVKNLAGSVFNKNEKLRSMISRDIYEIEINVKKCGKISKWVHLHKIFGVKCDEEPSDKFVRNFLAHSGFEKCVTLVKHKNNELYFKYDENKLGDILEASSKGLQTTQ